MRTELARVQTDAQKQSFERNGFTEYEFIANRGCCDICAGLDGKHFPVAKLMPGTNAPPMHPNCRCSTTDYVDREEYEARLDFVANGGDPAEWNKLSDEAKSAYKQQLTKSVKNDKIISGAINGAYTNKNDPDGSKREKHATSYYSSMRNRNERAVVSKISDNAGIDYDTVLKMYRHLFINEYDLETGKARFSPDYDIAESVRRLQDGKNIQDHDLVLIKHEALEHDLMSDTGMTYEEAHAIANKSYNYKDAIDRWKEKGGEK